MVIKDHDTVRAFHNVCRHHAMCLLTSKNGTVRKITCPYHGWEYKLDGRLAKATRITGIKNFSPKDVSFGLACHPPRYDP